MEPLGDSDERLGERGARAVGEDEEALAEGDAERARDDPACRPEQLELLRVHRARVEGHARTVASAGVLARAIPP